MAEKHHPDHYTRFIFTLEIVPEEETVIIEYPSGDRYHYTMAKDLCEYLYGQYAEILNMSPAAGNSALGPLIKYIKDNASDYYMM